MCKSVISDVVSITDRHKWNLMHDMSQMTADSVHLDVSVMWVYSVCIFVIVLIKLICANYHVAKTN